MSINEVPTPALIFDERRLISGFQKARELADEFRLKILYSLKANSLGHIVATANRFVDGFSCSSPFEARFARRIASGDKHIHYVSPSFPLQDAEFIRKSCTHVTFNSIEQWRRCSAYTGTVETGLRVNPEYSVYPNPKFDPCRTGSRLGTPVSRLLDEFSGLSEAPIQGLHFHTNAVCTDTTVLWETVQLLSRKLDPLIRNLRWINLGGGYLLHEGCNLEGLRLAVDLLRSRYEIEVLFEPGAGLVGSAGTLVSRVADRFTSAGEEHAILDTSAFHLPAAFDLDSPLSISGCLKGSGFKQSVGGATCLAGDVFGSYYFEEPLRIGDLVRFPNVGTYSSVKWHMFNGLKPPSIYVLEVSGKLRLLKSFEFEDFCELQGENTEVQNEDFENNRPDLSW